MVQSRCQRKAEKELTYQIEKLSFQEENIVLIDTFSLSRYSIVCFLQNSAYHIENPFNQFDKIKFIENDFHFKNRVYVEKYG